jgi:hypothetical protein
MQAKESPGNARSPTDRGTHEKLRAASLLMAAAALAAEATNTSSRTLRDKIRAVS